MPRQRDSGLAWGMPGARKLNSVALNGYPAICNTNAGQTIPDSDWTIINYETETVNDDGCVVVGASWTYTVPAGGTGVYDIKGSARFVAFATWAGKIAQLRINVSSESTLWYLDSKDNEQSTSHMVMLQGAKDVPLTEGDTVSIEIYQNTGGTLDLTTDPGFCCVSIRRTDALSA